MSVNIIEVRAYEDGKHWDDYVQRHPHGTGYHRFGWRNVIARAFGHHGFYFSAQDTRNEIVGVLPLILLRSALFGHCLVSMPFLNGGGILADSAEVDSELRNAAVTVAKRERLKHIELRYQYPQDIQWIGKCHKVSMVLELPDRYEALWQAFPSKLRSQIRRAGKEGMTSQVGGVELLEPFYQVFGRCMRDLGTPVYGRPWFEEMFREFPTNFRIIIVRHGTRAVAGCVVSTFGRVMEVPWAASDKRLNRMAPNMLLYSAMLEQACTEGMKQFNFGRSSYESGTYRFKEQWGAKPRPLYWYYWMANGESLPEVNPQNAKYRAPISLWRCLPISIANILGPLIVKYIP